MLGFQFNAFGGWRLFNFFIFQLCHGCMIFVNLEDSVLIVTFSCLQMISKYFRTLCFSYTSPSSLLSNLSSYNYRNSANLLLIALLLISSNWNWKLGTLDELCGFFFWWLGNMGGRNYPIDLRMGLLSNWRD